MESIETINTRLIEHFGRNEYGQAMFRIVWSNDQLEKRLINDTESGIHLLFPEVREMKKYPYIKDMYVLERVVVVPDFQQHELPTSKLSYEPVWTFCDAQQNPLPPTWPAAKFVVDTLYAALGKHSLRKYVDDEKNTTPEGREQRITELQDELFGDESDVGDALHHKQAMVVPPNYEKGE